jgi:hypothetical protein
VSRDNSWACLALARASTDTEPLSALCRAKVSWISCNFHHNRADMAKAHKQTPIKTHNHALENLATGASTGALAGMGSAWGTAVAGSEFMGRFY